MTEQEQPTDIATVIYTGEYDGKSTKTVHGYFEIDPDTHALINEQHEIFMKRALRGSRNPGSVFKLEIAERRENGKIKTWYTDSARLQGFTKNQDLIENHVIKWQAQTKARREAAATISDAKKDLVREALDAIKPTYEQLSPQRRKALIAYIIYYMMLP